MKYHLPLYTFAQSTYGSGPYGGEKYQQLSEERSSSVKVIPPTQEVQNGGNTSILPIMVIGVIGLIIVFSVLLLLKKLRRRKVDR